jgi:hypothetical protein
MGTNWGTADQRVINHGEGRMDTDGEKSENRMQGIETKNKAQFDSLSFCLHRFAFVLWRTAASMANILILQSKQHHRRHYESRDERNAETKDDDRDHNGSGITFGLEQIGQANVINYRADYSQYDAHRERDLPGRCVFEQHGQNERQNHETKTERQSYKTLVSQFRNHSGDSRDSKESGQEYEDDADKKMEAKR